MTPDRTWDPLRFQRGTRGFAAVVTALNGLVVLGVGALVVPAAGLPAPADAWIAGLAMAAGLVHLAAVVGLVRGRTWARAAVLYLAAAGIGVATFGILLVWRATEPVLGTADQTTIGFLVWMIGAWLVAARFTFKAFTDPRRTATVVLPTPRIVQPTTGHRVIVQAPRAALVAA